MSGRTREDLEEIGVAIADPNSLEPCEEERAAFVADWRRARESEAALLEALREFRCAGCGIRVAGPDTDCADCRDIRTLIAKAEGR